MAQVVLITGCSSGLGRALALCLHGQGYRVWATARNLASLDDLKAQGLKVCALDVTSDSSVAAAVAEVLAAEGRIDVLVNNAGLSRVGPLVEQPLEDVAAVLGTNTLGALRVAQAVAPSMMAARSGLVLNVGSVVAFLSSPYSGAYTASKAALLSLSDCLRTELAPWGVAVSYVVAGSIASAFGDNAEAGSGLARYEAPGSAYRPLAPAIRARAMASQDPRTSVSAEAAAARVAAVLGRATAAGRPPPRWFLAGGQALLLFLLGLWHKLVGWPVEGLLRSRFGLNRQLGGGAAGVK